MADTRPAAEQVHAAATQATGAGAGEQEADASLLDEPMYLVQERGQSLHLIDHDQPFVAGDLLAQASRVAAELEKDSKDSVVEEIVPTDGRQTLADQDGLTGLAKRGKYLSTRSCITRPGIGCD